MPGVSNGQTQLPLEDIVLPNAISWWPPAPGWWLLTVLGIALIIFTVLAVRRRYLAKAYQRQALKELQQFLNLYQQHQDLGKLCHDINSLLKRVAMIRFDRQRVSSLSGNAWSEFLQHTGPADFPLETAQQMQVVCYQAESQWPVISADALSSMAHSWIKTHAAASKQKRGR